MTNQQPIDLDVFCLGHASYDQVFSVAYHPASDEKLLADDWIGCGGGPAANAAVTVSRLGFRAGFGGYLGSDSFGDSHLAELINHQINCQFIARGPAPTPLSVVLVKPDGQRSLVNFKGSTEALKANAINFSGIKARCLLFDGHEAALSLALLAQYPQTPSVLDAGSLHAGTEALMDKVDYLVCSEKFARQYAGSPETALAALANINAHVVITLGERGLIWQTATEQGSLSAPKIQAIDTTGAGDAFHGAFAAAIASKRSWQQTLEYASIAGALACTRLGARPALPDKRQHQSLMEATVFSARCTTIQNKPAEN